MLKKRIIPCLDIKEGQVVKGVQYKNVKTIGCPVTLAAYYEANGADELVVYDIGAHLSSKTIMLDLIKDIKAVFRLPLTVGDGISTLDHVDAFFASGADKVSINSGAHTNKNLIKAASQKYGAQSIVGSLDTAYSPLLGDYEIVVKGSRQTTGIIIDDWIDALISQGIGELVVNVIDDDGRQQGYSLRLLKRLSSKYKLPIIASGGAGKSQDFMDLFTQTSCSAGLAASIFHSQSLTIPNLKKDLHAAGIAIRLQAT